MYNEDLGIETPDEIGEDVVEEALMGILTGEWTTEDTMLLGASFRTFAHSGLMTRDKGIVITTQTGERFQLTIIQSRGAF